MVGGGRDQHRRRDRGADQGREVDVLLEVGDLREALLERDREQEGEEDLDAGQGDAQLLQQLAEVAVEAFLLGLVAAGLASADPDRARFRSPLHAPYGESRPRSSSSTATCGSTTTRRWRRRRRPSGRCRCSSSTSALLGSRFAAPNRVAFMLEALRDLDEALRQSGRAALRAARRSGAGGDRGGARVRRRRELHVSADWSAYARRARGAAGAGLRGGADRVHRPPRGDDRAAGRGDAGRRRSLQGLHPLPPRLERAAAARARRRRRAGSRCPARLAAGRLPALESLTERRALAASALPGGESEGRKLMRAFLRDGLGGYEDGHDDLPGDGTSRLSAYLRWGCVSPLELARRGGRAARRRAPSCASSAGATSTTRCWRRPRPCPAATTARAATAGRARSGRCEAWQRGPHRLPAGRRGDAAAGRGGLHAQPGADDRRLLPLQGPLPRLARRAPGTSGTCSATARSPTTPATGSGSRGPATTPGPTASSTPCARPNASTPTATTCAATCRSWSRCAARRSSDPGVMEGFERLDYPEPIVDHDEAAAAFKAHRGA